MKRYSAILIAFFVASFALFSQPKIEIVGGETLDWGKVKLEDSPLTKKVQIKNAGTETLKILNVKPGCGCTTAPLDKTELGPGEIATMDVTLRLSDGGQVSKSIRIQSNDSEKENTMVILKADVFTPITVAPKYLSFRNMTVGTESKAVTTITNNTEEPIKIKNIKLNPEDILININPETVLKPHEPLAIEVNITPKEPGRLHADILLETDHQGMKQLHLTGWGNINPGTPPAENK